MPKTAFVKTDPLILSVERMVKELRDKDNFNIVGYTEVTSNTSDGVRKEVKCRKRNPPEENLYHFARTAASVMRLYMLKATDMIAFHNPEFTDRNEYQDRLMYKRIRCQENNPINLAANEEEAKQLSAEFDRQFPHYILENKLEGIETNQRRSCTSVMYVIDFERRELYHIVSSLTVTKLNDEDREFWHGIPFVAAFKVRLQNLPEEPDLDTHPRMKFIKDLIAEAYPVDHYEAWIQTLQDSHLEDNSEEIEDIVSAYFDQIE